MVAMNDPREKQDKLNRLYSPILKIDEDGKDFLKKVVAQTVIKRSFAIAARSAFVFFLLSSFVFILPIQAQQEGPVPDTQTQIAISSPAYPVTAGDVYSLTYMAGSVPVAYSIIVDYSYQIRVSNMALITGAGKTYGQLKQEVEAIVSKNYSFSGVQLALVKPGAVRVFIKGEVTRAAEMTTWAMGRLSSVVNGSLTNYSSTRNITVASANGQIKTYDLFKAQRLGDLREDPYLRPGDIITVSHIDRKVSVYGEVERPGSYELLPGENIRELIRDYANGYTAWAATDRVEVTRGAGNTGGGLETIYLTQEQINANYPLRPSDVVTVPLK
jgi:protein involved in polysaccharide export with SLBB domain